MKKKKSKQIDPALPIIFFSIAAISYLQSFMTAFLLCLIFIAYNGLKTLYDENYTEKGVRKSD